MSVRSVTSNQCNHINARGRRCRLTIAANHESLCTHHLRKNATSRPDSETLAEALLNLTGDLVTPGEVNALLGNVVKLLAHKHIDRKDAVAYGYLSQLLLSTLPGMEKKFEVERGSLAIQEVNKSIAEMQARFLARRAAAKAEAVARNSQKNSSTGTSGSSSLGTPPAPSNAPTSPEPAIANPSRDYASVRT